MIIIRGITKPIMTSKSNALQVKKMLEDASILPSHIFSFDKSTFKKSDIKFIEIVNDSVAGEEREIERNKFYDEERMRYNIQSVKTPEQKSIETDFFKLIYFCSCRKEPTQEILDKVIYTQKIFFEQNPRRTLCDYSVLKDCIDKDISKLTIFHDGGLRLVEKALFRDMQLAGQITSNYEK